MSGTFDLASFAQQVASVTGSGIVTNSSTAANFTVNNSGADTFAGTLTGSLALVKQNSGTLTLSGVNTYAGSTTINGGTLAISADSGLGTAPGSPLANSIIFSGGILEATATFTLNANRGITLTSAGTGGTLFIDPAKTLTYNGIIAGSNAADSFKKDGTGTLILGGVSTYSGATQILAGTLTNGIANALPTGTALSVAGTLDLAGFAQQVASVTGSGVVTDSATAANFTINNSSADTFAGTLTGSLALVKLNSGTLTLNSANTYTGATTISAGSIANGIANALPTSTALSVTGTLDLAGFAQQVASVTGSGIVTDSSTAANFIVNNSGADTFAGTLTGSLALVKLNSGTLTLSSANTYTGATTISAGTIANGTANALPTSTALSVTGTLDLAGFAQQVASVTGSGIVTDSSTAANFTINNSGADTFAGTLTGSLALVKLNSGTLTLSGVNTYTGSTTINGGVIAIAADSGLGTAPASTLANSLVFGGGTLESTATFTLNAKRGITFTASAGGGTLFVDASTTLTYNGIIAGANAADSFTKAGTGTLILGGVSTYSGATNIAAGTLTAGVANTLPTTTALIVTGIFDLAGFAQQVASVTGSGTVTDSAATANFTVNNSSADTFVGTLTGSLALVKSNIGTLTLSGVNTYSGNTSINGGILAIAADSGLGTAPVSPLATSIVFGGGTLETTATFTLNANRGMTFTSGQGGGTLLVDPSTTLTYNGIIAGTNAADTFTKSGTGNLILGNVSTYTGATTINAGTVSLGVANALPISTALAVTGTLDLAGFNQQVASVTGNGVVTDSSTAAVFTVNNGSADVFAGTLTGSLSLVEANFGKLTLSGINTYTGTTTINNGVINILADSGLGTAPASALANSIILNNGILETSGTFTLNANRGITLTSGNGGGYIFTDVGTVLTYNGIIAGTNAADVFTKAGTGTLILGGANTYSAGTSVAAGTLQNSIANALPTTTALSVSGTYDINGFAQQVASVTGSGIVTDSSTAANFTVNNSGADTFAGTLTGSLALIKQNSGTLTLSGVNTYSGKTTINGGTLAIAADSGLGTAPGSPLANSITFGGGILEATASFTLNANRGITLSSGGTGGTIFVDPTKTLTYNGIIAGANAADTFKKDGTGTLILGGVNTYSGATTLAAGTLAIGIANALPTATALANAGTFDLAGFAQQVASITGSGVVTDSAAAANFTINNSSADTFAGTMTGSLNLVKSAAGVLTLTGASSYTGSTTISAGTIANGIANALPIGTALSDSGTLDLAGFAQQVASITGSGVVTDSATAANFTINNSGTDTFAGTITGSLNLVKSAAGVLTLSGASSYTGSTTISAGTIANGIANALPIGTALSNSGTLNLAGFAQQVASVTGSGIVTDSAAAANFTVNNSGADTFAGTLTGSLALVKINSGTLTLSGVNTYSGNTTINGGTIAIGADSGLGAVPGSVTANSIVFGGGTLESTATFTLSANRGITFTSGAGGGTIFVDTSTTLTYNGIMAGSNAADPFTKAGTGTLILGGVSTYSGATNINAGTLTEGVANALPTSTALSVTGTLDLAGFAQQVASVTGSGIVTDSAAAANFTIINSSADTFAGTMTGSLNLVKSAAGVLTLSGASSYTGTTTISAGTIADGIANALPIGTALSNSGTLDLAGFAQQVASITGSGVVTDSATAANFTINNSSTDTFAGTMTGSLNLVKSAAGNLILNGASTYTGTTTISAGKITNGIANALPVATSLTNSGTLDIAGFAQQVASIVGSGIVTDSAAAANFTINNSDADTFAGTMTGSLNLVKSVAGILTLSGASSYTGTTTISAGTIANGIANALPIGTALSNSGTLDLAGFAQQVASITGSGVVTDSATAANFTINNSSADTFAGTMTGSLNLVKSAAGTLTLSGASSYTGTTTISAGMIANGIANALPTSTALSVTGTLDLAGFAQQVASVTGSGVVTDSAAAANFTINNSGADTFAGTMTGSLNLVKSNSGALTLSSANTYSGSTTISAGSIINGIANTLPIGTALSVTGTLDLAGFAQQVASVTGSGVVTDSAAAANFTINNSGADTFAGTLTGSLALVKINSGTLTLSGVNTYSGNTTINGGRIAIGADSGLGAAPGSVTANSIIFGGGTLESTATFTLSDTRGITFTSGAGGGTDLCRC